MDNQNGNKDNNKNNKQGFSFVILITMLTALLVFAMYQFQGVDSDQEITYNKFLKMIDEKKVEKVEIKSDRIAYVSTIAGNSIAFASSSGLFARIPIAATAALP